ncbi:MAG: SdpI family protein [Tepidanaerobacteraceae bacterium]|jgi:uncharacterized membrane protein|nr:SdpI family protein [Tepidanaerobacteraceae bacterium]
MNEKFKFRLPIDWWIIVLILALYALGFALYPALPDMMPSHWNLEGEVDGYMAKTGHIVFFPTLILGLYLLMSFAAKIDPESENYKKFRGVFRGFRIMLVMVLSGIYVATLLYAKGIPLSIGKVSIFSIGVLLIFIGNYFGKVRHNYTFGIKTPWTLASEEVWNRTHRVSGPLWVIAGLIWVFSIFLSEKTAFVIDMTALGFVGVYGFIYSCWLFNKLKNVS